MYGKKQHKGTDNLPHLLQTFIFSAYNLAMKTFNAEPFKKEDIK